MCISNVNLQLNWNYFSVPGPEIPPPPENPITPKPENPEDPIQEVFSVEFLGNELDSDSALTALNALFGVSIALACMFIMASLVSGLILF